MLSNTLSSIGVTLILLAYFLDLKKIIPKNSIYFLLNIFGSIFAGLGAFYVQLWPIVVLEIIWSAISIVEISKLRSKTLKT
jgi:hypothetical protein